MRNFQVPGEDITVTGGHYPSTSGKKVEDHLSLESKTEKVKLKDRYVCVMLKCGDCCIRQILASLFSSILFIVIITSYNWDIGDFGFFLRQWLLMG